ncbi:MAG: peptidoglycan DD-metalloendopeptidase family protein [Candidatus Nomurabacteria bacterium]|nr:peptidoglycan DD-metalloendopeptidase family protein [Candidatus Nomurabacteria bacterium]
MKLYLAYKKLFKIILTVTILLIPIAFSDAQTATDLKNQIDKKSADISSLEQEIASYQSQLDTLGNQKSSLSKSIKELDLTRKKLVADINVTQKKIDKTNLTIESLSSDINIKENVITNNLESIKAVIKQTDEYERSGITETLLSLDNFTLIWNDIDNIITVRESITKNTNLLKQTKNDLEDTRKETINAKNELTALKSELSDQQKIVIQNANEKNKLLAQTKNSETNYQKLLKDRLAKKDAFEKELRDYESQLQFTLDPSKLPGGGVLSWPLDSIHITQMFGKTVDSVRLYASGSHSGVDFRASIGTPVKAMADGTVLGFGNTDDTCVGTSFGKWIFIKYNDGLASAYGHLSLIKVSEGQQVKRGEIVGYSGNTGHTTGPHLHVAVYVSSAVSVQKRPSTTCGGKIYTMPIAPIGAYLDPLFYLPKLP